MIIILKKNAGEDKINGLLRGFEEQGLTCHRSDGAQTTIVGLVGDTSRVDIDSVRAARLWRTSSGYPSLTRLPTGNFIRTTRW